MKKVLTAIVLSAALVLSSVATAFAATPSKTTSEGTSTVVTLKTVTLKTNGKGTATLTKTRNKKKYATIPATVKDANGNKCKVTTIAAKSVGKKIVTLNIGKNVKTVKSKAFSNAKNLKKINIRGTSAIKFKKYAFKGINTKNITIRVNEEMSAKNYKALVKSLKNAGFKGKIKKAKM